MPRAQIIVVAAAPSSAHPADAFVPWRNAFLRKPCTNTPDDLLKLCNVLNRYL
jgi:hypothetical protein